MAGTPMPCKSAAPKCLPRFRFWTARCLHFCSPGLGPAHRAEAAWLHIRSVSSRCHCEGSSGALRAFLADFEQGAHKWGSGVSLCTGRELPTSDFGMSTESPQTSEILIRIDCQGWLGSTEQNAHKQLSKDTCSSRQPRLPSNTQHSPRNLGGVAVSNQGSIPQP